jgi:hypothetical protein
MAYMAGYDLKTNVMRIVQTSTSAASSLLREHEYCSVGMLQLQLHTKTGWIERVASPNTMQSSFSLCCGKCHPFVYKYEKINNNFLENLVGV